MAITGDDRSEIAFFDLETTMPTQTSHGTRAILEFGAILVCPRKLVELRSFATLVRPADLSHITSLSRCNGITMDALVAAPTFADIADEVYDLLHGRIWAGHNILRFDCARIREAYAEINKPAPEPKGTIDSLAHLTQKFGKRAGDMKMSTLATYFGLGQQTHRSLDDVRMNLEVVKYCAAVLFLESAAQNESTSSYRSSAVGVNDFLEPDYISIPSMSVTYVLFYGGIQKTQILHRNVPLQLQCASLKVRFGIRAKFVDHAGRPRWNFVVDASPNLCNILDAADSLAQKLSVASGSSSEWRPVVTFFNSPTVRLHVPIVADGETTQWATEIYQKDSLGTQRLVSGRFDDIDLETLLAPGNIVDVCFSLDVYDYQQNAGIRLVAKKLMFHSSS